VPSLRTDVFFIYAFHELALIPTFLHDRPARSWRQATRRAVAWKITVYLGIGSFDPAAPD